MSDYIKKDDAINIIQKANYISDNESLRLAFEIDDIPSADVIEPKRGEWIPDENGDFRCTNCGRIAEWEFFEDNFCPDCGARMKGADDE